jgi:hypothetical protein
VTAGEKGKHSRGSGGSHSWLPLKYNDAVSQVGGHDEVVFNYERCFLSVEDISVRYGCVSLKYRSLFRAIIYLFMTLLAMIRCSESRKLNGDPVRWDPSAHDPYVTHEDGSSSR